MKADRGKKKSIKGKAVPGARVPDSGCLIEHALATGKVATKTHSCIRDSV